MTEAEWLSDADPPNMLKFVTPLVRLRKLRLYACGCARLWWGRMTPEAHRAVKVAERYADGNATNKELADAQVGCSTGRGVLAFYALEADSELVANMRFVLLLTRDSEEDRLAQAELMRDVFGNPFRPLAKCPRAWKTSTVLALANGIYDQRAFDRMPILADALQDAGCGDERVVSHCLDTARQHVRGCWVLDLILGKK